MLGRRNDESVELECPVCGTEFKATASEAAMTGARRPGPKRSLSAPTTSAATTPDAGKMALLAIDPEMAAAPDARDTSTR